MPPLASFKSRPRAASQLRQGLTHSINSSPQPDNPPNETKSPENLNEEARAKDAEVTEQKKMQDSVKDASGGS